MIDLKFKDKGYLYYVNFDKTELSGNRYLIQVWFDGAPLIYIGGTAFSFDEEINWERPWYRTHGVIITDRLKKFCNDQLKFKAFW